MKERLLSSKANMVDGYLHAYEIANGEVCASSGSQSQTFQLKQFTYFKVARLKEVYLAKTRKADEAEDEYVISSPYSISLLRDTSPPSLIPHIAVIPSS